MPKICEHKGCSNPIWSRKTMRCKNHLVSQSVTLKKTKLKSVSTKQVKSNANVSKAKAIVLQEALERNGYLSCSSCDASQTRIHCSHLVPIGYNKELEAVVDNILLQCHKCHSQWENTSEGINQFKNIQDILDKVKKLDISYYNRIIAKIS